MNPQDCKAAGRLTPLHWQVTCWMPPLVIFFLALLIALASKRSQYKSERTPLCIAAISKAISILLRQTQELGWVRCSHAVDKANLQSCEDASSLLQIFWASVQEMTPVDAAKTSSHACSGATFTHRLAASPTVMLSLSLSQSRLFPEKRVFTIRPTQHCSHSPQTKLGAYHYLYHVYHTGSHYSCKAAVKTIERLCYSCQEGRDDSDRPLSPGVSSREQRGFWYIKHNKFTLWSTHWVNH